MKNISQKVLLNCEKSKLLHLRSLILKISHFIVMKYQPIVYLSKASVKLNFYECD